MELKQENDALKQKLKGLLIVPYGIETFLWGANDASKGTFNRTLWN